MMLVSVQRYEFVLSDSEIQAIRTLGKINCTEAVNCVGCPFKLSDGTCVVSIIRNIGVKEGLIDE